MKYFFLLPFISFLLSASEPVSLKIVPTPVEVKEGSTTELKSVVVYSDSNEKQVDAAVWSSKDSNILSVEQNATATGLKEEETTVTASYKGLISDATKALVYLEINGHRLPPEPDPVINNSTLLGIDANDNGVRDDVERKVYFTYDKKIDQLLIMQSLKTHQSMLADPELIKNAHKWQTPENKDMGCRNYLFLEHNISFDRSYTKFINNNTYNTKDRIKKYMNYNQALSGGVFGIPESANVESSCDFNISEALGTE